MTDVFAISALLSSISALMFGVYIFFTSRKNANSILFLAMSMSTALWGVSYWIWLSFTHEAKHATILLQILSVAAVGSVTLFLHWVRYALHIKEYLYRFILLPYSYGMLFISAILFVLKPSLFIESYYINEITKLWPKAGVLYLWHILFAFLIPLLLAFLYLVYKYILTNNDKKSKAKAKNILWGAIFGFLGAGTNFFLWFQIPIYPYGNFLMLFYPPLVAYSTLKFGLFKTKNLIVDIIVFFILLASLLQILASRDLISFIWNTLFGIILIFASFVLVRSFRAEYKLRNETEKIVKELKKRNEHIKKISRKKSEFLSIATHQLRAPLTVMKGQLSLLLEGNYGEIRSELKDVIKKIYESVDRMSATVDEFLDVSRVEQGKMRFNFSFFNLTNLLSSVYDELKEYAKEKGIELNLQICSNEKNFTVYADKEKLRHVIFNLVENAIKYTEKGFVRIALCNNQNRYLRVEIKDSGVGIEKDELKSLFSKFVRSRNVYGVNVLGSGLGLYIAREIMHAHNGRIWAESEGVGKGSSFFIELPKVETEKANEEPKA